MDKDSKESLDPKVFFEKRPPGDISKITPIISRKFSNVAWELAPPELWLECDSEHCGGFRWFKCVRGEPASFYGTEQMLSFHYKCKNCGGTSKLFSAMLVDVQNNGEATAIKIGEHPPFGPSVPSALISLTGPDRELFLKGRRCENQGMGIAAFAYYRRIVEEQKNRIFAEIIRVVRNTTNDTSAISTLEKAKAETQFSRAVDLAKDAIPSTLNIGGFNPLKLLHSALSDGLHSQSDDVCLTLATDIRLVLTRFAEVCKEILRDETQIKSAVTRLLNRGNIDSHPE